jgi:hypothetical protein
LQQDKRICYNLCPNCTDRASLERYEKRYVIPVFRGLVSSSEGLTAVVIPGLG